jgi:hypothetical protein
MRTTLKRPTLLLAVTALLLATLAVALAPRAGAVTFGANLTARQPDNPYRCHDFIFYAFIPTCSAESANLTTGESGFPPVGVGVVTQVRVKVGPVTGPMQIVVEEALRKDNPSDPGHPTYACCKAINVSQVFTPAANATTPVNVNLQVRQDIAPDPQTGFYVDDHLALSVLAPNVPIPADLDNTQTIGTGIWLPAWQAGEERGGSVFGTSGAQILFNAEWSPAPGADQSPIEFLRRNVVVRNGNAFLPLLCNLTIPCDGRVRLQNLTARLARLDPGAARERQGVTGGRLLAKKTAVTYAKKKFIIKAGKKKTLKVPLGRKGKRLFRNRQKAKVWANFKLRDVAESAFPSTRIKLKEKG